MYGRGGHKLEINIPSQQIYANSMGGLIIEGGIMLSEYSNIFGLTFYHGEWLYK